MNDPEHVHDSINLLAGAKVNHTARPKEASKTMEYALQGRETEHSRDGRDRSRDGRGLSSVLRGIASLFRRSST